MTVYDKVRYVRATHVMHTRYGAIEFQNYLDRNHVMYRISDVRNKFVPGDESVMFDMIVEQSQIPEIQEFLEELSRKPINYGVYIGTESKIVWWHNMGHYICTSPLGTDIAIDVNCRADLEEAYHNFDVDEYAIRRFGDASYPLDMEKLLEDGKIIKQAYLDLYHELQMRL